MRKESKQKTKTKELKPKIQRKKTKRRLIYSSPSSEDDDRPIEMVLSSGGESEEDFNQNQCAECYEMYSETLSTSDWISATVALDGSMNLARSMQISVRCVAEEKIRKRLSLQKNKLFLEYVRFISLLGDL